MATKDDVRKLAALARLSITDRELETLAAEFDAILGYVGQLEKLDIETTPGKELPPLRNVFRDDGEPHEAGAYTEKVAAQFPDREGDALVVKQIISHD